MLSVLECAKRLLNIATPQITHLSIPYDNVPGDFYKYFSRYALEIYSYDRDDNVAIASKSYQSTINLEEYRPPLEYAFSQT
jgi:hypothetical protein